MSTAGSPHCISSIGNSFSQSSPSISKSSAIILGFNGRRCHATRVMAAGSSFRYGFNHQSYVHLSIPASCNFKINAIFRYCILKTFPFKRASIITCATSEDIRNHKSSVEKNVKERMSKTIDFVRLNFNSMSTGRANTSMLDRVEVEYYKSRVSLKSVAQISVVDARSLLVHPHDKSSLKVIEKAIVDSNMGLTPTNEGEALRISIPQLTAERRKELHKIVARFAEDGKISLRNARRDALKAYDKLEKGKKLSKDNVRDLSADLQIIMNEHVKMIDSIYKEKEKELLRL